MAPSDKKRIRAESSPSVVYPKGFNREYCNVPYVTVKFDRSLMKAEDRAAAIADDAILRKSKVMGRPFVPASRADEVSDLSFFMQVDCADVLLACGGADAIFAASAAEKKSKDADASSSDGDDEEKDEEEEGAAEMLAVYKKMNSTLRWPAEGMLSFWTNDLVDGSVDVSKVLYFTPEDVAGEACPAADIDPRNGHGEAVLMVGMQLVMGPCAKDDEDEERDETIDVEAMEEMGRVVEEEGESYNSILFDAICKSDDVDYPIELVFSGTAANRVFPQPGNVMFDDFEGKSFIALVPMNSVGLGDCAALYWTGESESVGKGDFGDIELTWDE